MQTLHAGGIPMFRGNISSLIITFIVAERSKKHQHPLSPVNPLTWKLFLFIVSIPLGALYIGYAIGNYLMPPSRKFPDRGVVVDIGSLNYSWYNTHYITVDYVGGLGNQMFQYASMYGISRANGLKPISTTETRIFDVFPLLKAKPTVNEEQFTKYSTFNEFNPSAFDGRSFSLNFMKNMKLEGFFQSWRYFDHVRSDIRKQFTFPSDIRQKVDTAMKDIYKLYSEHVDPEVLSNTKRPVQFVGVHIRRGDTLDNYNVDKGYTVADAAYMHRAVDYYDVTYRHVIYVVCTDDEEWAKENTKTLSKTSLVVLSPLHALNPAYDLCLLAMCNHTVMTVGTFGWWGAWLAAGDVVYYKNYPEPSSTLARHFKRSDYYLPQWIPL